MSIAIPISDKAQALMALAPTLTPPAAMIMPVSAIDAVNDALDREETHYTDRPGILPLRQKVSAALKARFGVAFDAKAEVVITCGVTEARFLTIQQLCNPGDTLFSAGCGDAARGAAVLRGVDISDTPANAKLVHLGSSLGETAIREAIAAAPAGAFILYEVQGEGSHFHPSLIDGCNERTVTIGGIMEDDVLASARIGYLAAPLKSAPGLRDFKQALTICTTNLSQWAALAAWNVA